MTTRAWVIPCCARPLPGHGDCLPVFRSFEPRRWRRALAPVRTETSSVSSSRWKARTRQSFLPLRRSPQATKKGKGGNSTIRSANTTTYADLGCRQLVLLSLAITPLQPSAIKQYDYHLCLGRIKVKRTISTQQVEKIVGDCVYRASSHSTCAAPPVFSSRDFDIHVQPRSTSSTSTSFFPSTSAPS